MEGNKKEVKDLIIKEMKSWSEEEGVHDEVNIFFLEKMQVEERLKPSEVEELIDIMIILHRAIKEIK